MLIGLVIMAALLAISYAVFSFFKVKKMEEGTDRMKEIASAIRLGADTFISYEYRIVAIIAAAIAVFLTVLISWQTACAFIIGATMSASAGFIGMKIATYANVRVSNKARTTGSLGETLIMHSMDEMNIRHDFVHVASETRTNLKIYDPTTKMYTDINEPGFELPAERLDEVETKLFYYAKPGDYVVFAGGAPSGVPNDTLYKWTKKLKARNVSVIADLDGELLKNTVAARPFMIKPNLAELMRLCGLRDTSIYTLVDVAKKLVAEGIRTVVVSLGSDGALFVNANEALYAKSPRAEAISTVGAGDAMTAALVYSLSCNHRWRDAIVLAMATATAKVMCEGNTPPQLEKVKQYMSQITIESC